MDTKQLRRILKPVLKDLIREGIKSENGLIKQCVREIILEDGTISKLISEVVRGLGNDASLLAEKTSQPRRKTRKPHQANEGERAARNALGDLTPSSTLDDDEVLAEQQMAKRNRARQQLENDRQELLAHRDQKKNEMSRVLGATGVDMEIFETVDIETIPGARVGSRATAGGTTLGANHRGKKGDGGAAMPLRGHSPNDPGVNITGILKLVGGAETWAEKV